MWSTILLVFLIGRVSVRGQLSSLGPTGTPFTTSKTPQRSSNATGHLPLFSYNFSLQWEYRSYVTHDYQLPLNKSDLQSDQPCFFFDNNILYCSNFFSYFIFCFNNPKSFDCGVTPLITIIHPSYSGCWIFPEDNVCFAFPNNSTYIGSTYSFRHWDVFTIYCTNFCWLIVYKNISRNILCSKFITYLHANCASNYAPDIFAVHCSCIASNYLFVPSYNLCASQFAANHSSVK
ncbi:hypothetical protein QR680_015656 [Steinernema hermaphroditum]|uniref:Uncharacterized protein n=1 Tax=Steinernema hermaphroditum TaxID=289476 RepID=A0AA39H9M3_9BILA|nr:hypothetical protein QR680_015656 [Steinernema hermaphroditum]